MSSEDISGTIIAVVALLAFAAFVIWLASR